MATTSFSTIAERSPAPAGARPYCGGQEPVFVVALAFSAGIVAANYFWRSPLAWLIAFLVAIAGAAFFYRRSPQMAFALGLLAVVPLGGFYLQARDAAQPTVAQILQPFATGQNEVEVIGSVIREGIVRDGRYGGKQESVDVQTERLQQGARVLNEAVGVRLTIFSRQAEEDEARDDGNESPLHVYTYGQRLHFIAKLRLPRNYRNPGATDMAGYLGSQGIRLTGSARATSVEVLPWIHRQSNRAMAKRGTAQRAGAHREALARRTRRPDAGHADRRPGFLWPRNQD